MASFSFIEQSAPRTRNMSQPRSALSAENLAIIDAVDRLGSMAAAARELGMVPSALTYRVRQIEDALDVLLFDRSTRNARLTPAGEELLRAGRYLLEEFDAVAERVRRIATGWPTQFTIAADALIARATLFEMCQDFHATGAPTRLRLRAETLSGTLETLESGQADIALGVSPGVARTGILSAPIGRVKLVFAVAPHHPLAGVSHPLCEEELHRHRAVAVADSARRGAGATHNILPGQEVFTVPSMQHKLEAQLRGIGAGFLPAPLAQPYIDTGRLVVKALERSDQLIDCAYAWRRPAHPKQTCKALAWWLERLEHPLTRRALLEQHYAGQGSGDHY